MNESDKLEDCKKEIRSILIPYQRGCVLSEFNKAYRELIGKRLPIKDFGFRADIEFLYSIPDVVKITPTRTGEYHLMAVADEKSVHIQKMVAKQKPSKTTKAVARIYRPPKTNFDLPPRFAEPFRKHYESNFKDTSKVSGHKVQPKLEPKLPPEKVSKKPEKVHRIPPRFEPKLLPKSSPKEEVIELVKYFDNQILFKDLLVLYQRMYQKELSLSTYGFSSLEECISEIPELDIESKDKCTYIVYYPESSEAPVVMNQNCSIQDNSALSSNKDAQSIAPGYKGGFCSETKDISQSEMYNNQNEDKVYVPDSLKKKLEMVAKKYTRGILSSVFSYCFEEVTETPLDLHSLGYRCLSDLIDSVPDIFMRERVAGSKKDFIIYSVRKQTSELNGKKIVHHVIVNIRRILQAYPEGIELKDFLHIYSINCNDTLCIKDFGFDDLETFLTSIKNQVPLKISPYRGVKIVHMLQDSAGSSHSAGSETSQEEIPFDAAPPGYKFKPQSLPDNFDFSKYFPVYTSSVSHPEHLYIQIQGENTVDALITLAEKIETFYSGRDSSCYIMQNIHINVGASCVALWPTDGHWYRAVITSVLNTEEVKVYYVDYGTKDKIPKSSLRYLKKDFADLPAQALRCRLAFLKPANHATMWNAAASRRILNLCEDISLMAKIEDIGADGVYSIILCDTNGEEDVYINDVLCNEGLADYANRESPVASQPESVIYNHNLNPLWALQAQYYLQAFITVAPSFANNENYINLMREVSMCCVKPELGRPNKDMSSAATLVPPGFTVVPMNATAYVNSTVPCNTFNMVSPQPNTNLKMERKFNIPNAPTLVSSDDSETFMSVKTAEDGNGEAGEIFDDDDDDIFQEFCEKVSLEPVRHVKRVLLGEGYKIHIIVVQSKPYVSSDDVSRLIWSNKEDDYLFRRLQLNDVEIPYLTLSESGNEELFQQLQKFCVRGIQKMDGLKSRILLHPLRVVIKILNIFGHPSINLRTKLIEEIAHFDPDDSEWTNFSSPEPLEQEEEETLTGVTDDDKIEKLCLFDLLAMKESITFRRKKLEASLRSRGNDIKCDEMDKLEQLHQKVLQRIQEIKEICSVFS